MIEYFRLNIEYLRNFIIFNRQDTIILGILGNLGIYIHLIV